MKARAFALLLWISTIAFALAGCGTTGLKEVKVPVAVTCQTPPPMMPKYQVIAEADGLFVRVQKLLVNDALHEAYEEELLAWGRGCNA